MVADTSSKRKLGDWELRDSTIADEWSTESSVTAPLTEESSNNKRSVTGHRVVNAGVGEASPDDEKAD